MYRIFIWILNQVQDDKAFFMYSAVDLKIGKIFVYRDEPYKVLTYKHTHMARGSADVRLKIRGLLSGNILPTVFGPNEKFEQANLSKRKMQFLYKEDNTLYFMNPTTYDQIELNKESMGEETDFLQDGETYDLLYWDAQAIGVEIPPKATVEIIDCDPGVKGNSAANMYKSAVVTGGIQIRVPLFIDKGEKIRIDTVGRKYVERAK
jgi:elongation factor P